MTNYVCMYVCKINFVLYFAQLLKIALMVFHLKHGKILKVKELRYIKNEIK